jgi:N-acetylmuramoyl-L-alanine amidase
MPKIMLDAGHDINTPGKRALDGSMREFEFNKAVVLKVSETLKGYENTEVTFSHDLNDGIDTSLKARTDLANRLGVNVFLSVHANAGPTSAKGVETFVYPKAPAQTVRLGDIIHTELARLTKEETLNRGLKRADFAVLRDTHMDSVLVECGFMTNAQDLAWLKNDAYRNDVAAGLVNGLVIFLGLRKKQISTPALAPQSKPQPVQGIGTLKVLEKTVIRDKPVYLGAITGNVETNGEYIVHDYQTGWFNIGGWVSSKYVQFIPHNDTKIIR